MTIALADARHTAEATSRPKRLAFKTATAESGQMIALDEAEGIVTAIVSVTGTEDEVADVIVPGAYTETLTKRRPKVCWAHSWERPIGRVLHIEELLPGDERLPTQTKDGAPWPAEAGALVATMQFNMKSDAGREAFEAVRFYSETGECEYSIGYQVPAGKASRDRAGVRHIKSLDLYELSVVLFGAHTMTGTLSIKTAAAMARAGRRLSAKDVLAALREEMDAQILYGNGTDIKAVNDFSDGVMIAVYPDPEAADAIYDAISGTDKVTDRDDLHITLAYLGTTNELSATSTQDVAQAVTDAVEGMAVLEGQVGGIGVFPDSGDGAPTWIPVDVPGLSMLREQIVDALGDLVHTDHGFTPHITIGYDLGLVNPVPEIPVRFDHVRVVWGTQDRRVSLGTGVHDKDQSRTFESPSTAEGKAMPQTVEEAARLTAIADLCSWPTGPEPEVKAEGGADRNRGNAEELRQYWTTGAGGAKIAWNTPGDFTRCTKLLAEHMTPERAKGYCANRHKEMTGMWPGDKDNKGLVDAYDPSYESKGADSPSPGAVHDDTLSGTYEERLTAVRAAVNEALRGEPRDDDSDRYEWDYVSVDGTWPDRVIATRVKWDAGDESQRESYEMGYRFTDNGVELTEPEQVVLEMRVVPLDAGSGEEPTLADALDLAESVYVTASAFHAARMQTKAGRVLSGANERRLRDAVENLLNVLAAAGVQIEKDPAKREDKPTTDTDPRREVDPSVDLETTAPAAEVKGGPVVLDVEDVNAQMRALGLPEIRL